MDSQSSQESLPSLPSVFLTIHPLTLFMMLQRGRLIEMWIHALFEVAVSTLFASVINRFCASLGASSCKLMTAAQGNEQGLKT